MKTFKDYFDKIYCINYVEAPERRESIMTQLSKLNLTDGVEFSYGMPFHKIESIKKCLGNGDSDFKEDLNIKTKACALNHYTAIKTAYETGANTVLIFEDDCTFIKNRDTIIDYLDNAPKDWDYLYFTPSFIGTYSQYDWDLCRNSEQKFINMKNLKYGRTHCDLSYNSVNVWMSSCAYALSRKAMQMYILMFEKSIIMKNSDCIEYFFHNLSQSPLVSYTTNIRLFAQMCEIDVLKYDEANKRYIASGRFIPLSTNVTSENFFKIDFKNSIIWNIN